MNLKTRLNKLEERHAQKSVDITQLQLRLRELTGKALGLDLSQCSDAELEGHARTLMRLAITEYGGAYGDNWTDRQHFHEFSRIMKTRPS